MKIYDYGNNGTMQLGDGHKYKNLVFIVMEYIEGGTLFDLVG